jgi:putative redox protein
VATVTVETEPGRLFATRVTGPVHTLVADEPAPDGDDLGFSPYELLLASLGSCTAMTLEMYARRKAWPLEQVRITLAFDRVHLGDAENCEQPQRRIDRITREIELIGPLDEEQRRRLVEIAGKCPVHKTLTSGPTIVDRLAAEAMMG